MAGILQLGTFPNTNYSAEWTFYVVQTEARGVVPLTGTRAGELSLGKVFTDGCPLEHQPLNTGVGFFKIGTMLTLSLHDQNLKQQKAE